MNKTELIAAMAANAELSKKDAEMALKAFIDVVTEELKKGEKVQLVGFGTFEVSERPAREGINPQSKEKITIAASKKPSFTASTPPFTAFVKLFCATLVATNVSINEININIVRFIQFFLLFIAAKKNPCPSSSRSLSQWLFKI